MFHYFILFPGMCGNFQVGNYIQPLWEEIKPAVDSDSPCELYNGAVEAVTTLIGAGLALALGFTKVTIWPWRQMLCKSIKML